MPNELAVSAVETQFIKQTGLHLYEVIKVTTYHRTLWSRRTLSAFKPRFTLQQKMHNAEAKSLTTMAESLAKVNEYDDCIYPFYGILSPGKWRCNSQKKFQVYF